MRFLAAGLVLFFTFFIASPVLAQDGHANHTSAEQAILVDYDTGMVLFEKNADAKMPTSSMSKVMSMYLVFEALRDGRLRLDTELPVSEKAWKKQGSKMFVEVDSRVAVEDLIRGVIVQSGNDATIVLAEGLAGTEDAFAEALTAKAKEIGMEHSNFKNASGWPDPDHYSTARDLATLSRHLIADFPEYYQYFKETEFTYNDIKQPNRNPLLFQDIGADGIKTGHTEAGGYGLMGSGVRDGRRVIMVINGLEDSKGRAQEGARLLEWGLKGFTNVAMFKKGDRVDDAPVIMGKSATVPMVIDQDVSVTIPLAVKNDLKVTVEYMSPLEAPIRKGDQVGTLNIDVPRVKSFSVPLYAGANVENLGFFAATITKARLMLSGGQVR